MISNGVQRYTVAESATPSVVPGDVVSYTVTAINTGSYSYPGDTASLAVDLSGQLDDGSVVAGSITAGTGSAAVTATLTWTGPLPGVGVGSTVTVTYQVRISPSDTGDHLVVNTVTATSPGGLCAVSGNCARSVAVQSYTASLATDTGVVTPGQDGRLHGDGDQHGPGGLPGRNRGDPTVDLGGVSDDAAYVACTRRQPAPGRCSSRRPSSSWTGPLPVAPAPARR